MSDIKINWISVKDQLPDKIGPDLYEPVTFVTVKYCDTSYVIYKDVEYGEYGVYDADDDYGLIYDGIGWRYYNDYYDGWCGYENDKDCKIIAWSRDRIEPYKEEENV